MTSTTDLLLEIARCPVVAECKAGAKHPCSKIVAEQAERPLATHQVPEPWTGRLESAVLLFLSSNPSISADEDYPEWPDDDERMQSYFRDRFDGRSGQIKDGIYAPRREGGWQRNPVRFWVAARARAQEVLPGAVAGTDYAMTEVVHCKSTGEGGVPPARKHCSDRYLLRVLEAAPLAAVVLVYGAQARRSVKDVLGIDLSGDSRYAHTAVGGRLRHLVHLDHPAGFGKVKTVTNALSEEQLAAVREACEAARRARG